VANDRLPGPACQHGRPADVDDGTMCRASSAAPGPTRTRGSDRAQRGARGLRDMLVDAAVAILPNDVVVGAFLTCLPEGGMGRRFVVRYAYGGGRPWRLNDDEMADCNAAIDLFSSDHPQFRSHCERMRSAGLAPDRVTFQGTPRAMTVGTLGGFTSHYEGTISFDSEGYPQFEGTMHWTDRWDFESHTQQQQNAPSGRGESGERMAAIGRRLPGTPFEITSQTVRCHQRVTDRFLQWYGSTPLHPPRWVDARASTLLGGEGVIALDMARSGLRALRAPFQWIRR